MAYGGGGVLANVFAWHSPKILSGPIIPRAGYPAWPDTDFKIRCILKKTAGYPVHPIFFLCSRLQTENIRSMRFKGIVDVLGRDGPVIKFTGYPAMLLDRMTDIRQWPGNSLISCQKLEI